MSNKLDKLINKKLFRKLLKEQEQDILNPDMSDYTSMGFKDVASNSEVIQMKDPQANNNKEIFKNSKFGQISMFSINPKKTRGCHYHNTKTESFLVIQGRVTFNLQNLNTKKNHKITISSKDCKIIKIPSGYYHSIKNLTNSTCLIIVWANEVFNPNQQDTFAIEV